MKFIFIAGASASGKTTLAEKLKQQLLTLGVFAQQISMDDYSVEAPHDIEDIQAYRRDTNFDRIEMLDLELLKEHVNLLHLGKLIEKPIFEFSSNSRVGSQTIFPSDVIIIEGLFALYFAKTLKEFNLHQLTVFVGKSSYQQILNSRLQRDVNIRNFFATDVIKKERRDVGPAFFQIIAKSKSGVDFDITNDEAHDGLHPLDIAVADICHVLLELPSVLSNSIPLDLKAL